MLNLYDLNFSVRARGERQRGCSAEVQRPEPKPDPELTRKPEAVPVLAADKKSAWLAQAQAQAQAQPRGTPALNAAPRRSVFRQTPRENTFECRASRHPRR
jgi:hypothetical protein